MGTKVLVLTLMSAILSSLCVTASRAEELVQTQTNPSSETTAQQNIESKQSGPDARKLFAQVKLPADLPVKSIGTATCGCIAGAQKLPSVGPGWQVMRVSRNRYWGHPSLIEYLEKLAKRAQAVGWNGLLIGDMSMPRGGPMPSGHASHQRGTDVDIWLTQAPDHKWSIELRETLNAGSVLKLDSADLDPVVWTPAHAEFVRAAAQDENVARIFVTPAIKKYLCSCKDPAGADTAWLRRLRPWEGHDDHIHVRLKCPKGEACIEQDPPPEGDGCGDELTAYYKKIENDPPNKSVAPPEKEEYSPYPLSKLPKECQELLKASP